MRSPARTSDRACRRLALVVAILVGGAMLPLAASAEALPEGSPEPAPPTRSCEGCEGEESGGGERLGAAAGWLSRLEERGIFPEAHVLWDSSRVVDGGVRKRWTSRWLLQLGATLDLDRLAGWHGATAFVGFHVRRGRDGSLDTGDIQAYSNIDADRFTEIDELWLEQVLFGGRVRVKAGRIDANTEFACVEAAGDFLNSSAGVSPTILTLPTYPDPEPGINVFVAAARWLEIGAGVYRSSRGGRALTLSPGDRFLVVEAKLRWTTGGGGVLGLGHWHETARLERFDGRWNEGASGAYATFQQRLWGSAEGRRAIDAFAQYGFADENVSPFGHHYGLGLLATAPLPARPADVAGVMVSRVDLSDVPAAGFPDDETAWEVFWFFEVTPWLRLQPDVQYIQHPSGGADGIDDALVATLRVHLDF